MELPLWRPWTIDSAVSAVILLFDKSRRLFCSLPECKGVILSPAVLVNIVLHFCFRMLPIFLFIENFALVCYDKRNFFNKIVKNDRRGR
jgi:hypothetical protein